MAKQKYYTPKKGNGVGKIVAATACALAIAAGACAVGVGTGGFKDWTFSKWFGEAQVQEGESNVNGNAVIGEGESNGVSLMSAAIAVADYDEYGIDTQAESAYNLSVTYTPSNTTFQGTTYSIAWKNPYSEWASGKNVTDYATVVQTEEGSKDAVLTVLQSFSEQIIVTAAHSRNEDIKATCSVDFVCDTYSIGFEGRHSIDGDVPVTYGGWHGGTLTPDMTATTIEFKYDVGEGFVNAAKAVGFTVNRYYTQTLNANTNEEVVSIESIYEGYILADAGLSSEQMKDYLVFLGEMFFDYSDGDSIGQYQFTVHRVYNGVTYDDYVGELCDYDYGTDFSDAFEINLSIEFDNSSIIAG